MTPHTIVCKSTSAIALLTESNSLYNQMLTLLKELSDSPEADSEQQLARRNAECNDLQQRITAVDTELQTALQSVPTDKTGISTLLNERHEVMNLVYAANRSVLTKLEAVKSLLADEIRKCTEGHVALRGYRQHDSFSGGSTFKTAL